ncbi:MAG: multicopper oxidase family protein [Arenicellales bacterium]|nr:multicopper oxidase family protein [Arenicellales bacterium]
MTTVALPRISYSDEKHISEYELVAAPTESPIVGEDYPETAVLSYNSSVPGPEIRLKQGDRLRVTLLNRIDQETTVHWHGIRLPNAMDGVPYLTQAPVAPGETFTYEFDLPDAGTFWYHPHVNSSEQVGRGLYGALIVEEPEVLQRSDSLEPIYQRELTWILDDWRFDQTATIQPFGVGHDASHGGRIGNVVTINGRLPQPLRVRSGERLRLRLINAANARHFALVFEGHSPHIIAIDGQPTVPHSPDDDTVVLAPAMRTDLLLDMSAEPGSKTRIIDSFYRDPYLLNEIVYSSETALRTSFPDPVALPGNPLSEPDLANAHRYDILFAGGAMGGMRGALVNGRWKDIRSMVNSGLVWAINGVAASSHELKPSLTLQRDKTYIFSLQNDTVFPHPIHLHGHHFRVIRRNKKPTKHREWQDTVLVQAREQVDIAFVADNPGDWMFHCHIPEHMEAGMMSVVRVV